MSHYYVITGIELIFKPSAGLSFNLKIEQRFWVGALPKKSDKNGTKTQYGHKKIDKKSPMFYLGSLAPRLVLQVLDFFPFQSFLFYCVLDL